MNIRNRRYFPKPFRPRKGVVYKPALFLVLKRTNNNLFFSVTKRDGKPLYQTTAGVIGLSGSRRDSPTSAEISGKKILKQIKLRGYTRCYLRIAGLPDPCLRAAVRGLRSAKDVIFSKLDYVQPIAHNGVRLRKERRK
jgi:ribosomal protein S11